MSGWWVAYAVCAAVTLIGSLEPITNWPTARGATLYAVGIMLLSPILVLIWTLVGIHYLLTSLLERTVGR